MMNKTKLIIGTAVIVGFIWYTNKKKKENFEVLKNAVENKNPAINYPADIDSIRIKLFKYIELKNLKYGVSKTPQEINHDVMIITS